MFTESLLFSFFARFQTIFLGVFLTAAVKKTARE